MGITKRLVICGCIVGLGFMVGGAHRKPMELACMDRFDIDTYVAGGWAGPGPAPTNDPGYVTRDWEEVAEDGLNSFVCGSSRAGLMRHLKGPAFDRLQFDFDHIRKLGIKPMLDANYWAVWHLPDLHRRYGHRRGVLGYHMSDDNGDLYQVNVDAAWWLRNFAPNRVPWMTQNPNPIPQSRCYLPVVTSQNYPWSTTRSSPRSTCDTDRLSANRYDMASWMIFTARASPSQYRFQVNAAAAYGSQGVWLFVYDNSFHPIALAPTIRSANRYLVKIAGPYLLGRRCP